MFREECDKRIPWMNVFSQDLYQKVLNFWVSFYEFMSINKHNQRDSLFHMCVIWHWTKQNSINWTLSYVFRYLFVILFPVQPVYSNIYSDLIIEYFPFIYQFGIFIFSPDGKKFRSKSDIKNYLENSKLMDYDEKIFDFRITAQRQRKSGQVTEPKKNTEVKPVNVKLPEIEQCIPEVNNEDGDFLYTLFLE